MARGDFVTCCFKEDKPAQSGTTIVQQAKDYLPYILLALALLGDK